MKAHGEAVAQPPETKLAAAAEEMTTEVSRRRRQLGGVHVSMRVGCLVSSVTALSLMVTAEQSGNLSIFGFNLPISSNWSYSSSFQYLVGVSAAVAAHSLLQFLISLSRLLRKSPVIPSRYHAWLIFAADQVFAYVTMSAGSAASGVTNLNRTGIKHSNLPNFCKPLHGFCNRVAVSIAFAFVSCFFLAVSTVVDVLWLSEY